MNGEQADFGDAEVQNRFNALMGRLAPELFRHRRLSGLRDLAYYTSAATGFQILENGEIWLRNVRLMNDAQEIRHALDAIYHAFDGKPGDDRMDAIKRASPPFFEALRGFFDGPADHIINATYAISFSLHCATRNAEGRLSMWRGYGADCPVAFIFGTDSVEQQGGTLPVYSGAIRYMHQSRLIDELDHLILQLDANAEELRSLGENGVRAVVGAYVAAAACLTKHPAFREEREYRLFHIEGMPPLVPALQNRLDIVPKVVSGRPQKVLTLKFSDYSDFGLGDYALERCLKAIIVGPMEGKEQVREAFISSLSRRMGDRAHDMVRIAPIPYRARL